MRTHADGPGCSWLLRGSCRRARGVLRQPRPLAPALLPHAQPSAAPLPRVYQLSDVWETPRPSPESLSGTSPFWLLMNPPLDASKSPENRPRGCLERQAAGCRLIKKQLLVLGCGRSSHRQTTAFQTLHNIEKNTGRLVPIFDSRPGVKNLPLVRFQGYFFL